MTDRSSGSDIDTPSSSASTHSPDSPLSPSVAVAVTAQLTGAGLSGYGMALAARLLLLPETDLGPLGIPRWLYGLTAIVVIAVPTSMFQIRRLLEAALRARR